MKHEVDSENRGCSLKNPLMCGWNGAEGVCSRATKDGVCRKHEARRARFGRGRDIDPDFKYEKAFMDRKVIPE
jgi:hypothetical protein